jgi:hypothetical protein
MILAQGSFVVGHGWGALGGDYLGLDRVARLGLSGPIGRLCRGAVGPGICGSSRLCQRARRLQIYARGAIVWQVCAGSIRSCEADAPKAGEGSQCVQEHERVKQAVASQTGGP